MLRICALGLRIYALGSVYALESGGRRPVPVGKRWFAAQGCCPFTRSVCPSSTGIFTRPISACKANRCRPELGLESHQAWQADPGKIRLWVKLRVLAFKDPPRHARKRRIFYDSGLGHLSLINSCNVSVVNGKPQHGGLPSSSRFYLSTSSLNWTRREP